LTPCSTGYAAVVVAVSSAKRAARSPWVGRLGRLGFAA
jgi:hypothetical protein